MNEEIRQPMGWENIFTNDTSAKGLRFKIYKTFRKPNSKKTKKPNKKTEKQSNLQSGQKDLNRHLCNRTYRRPQAHKKCSVAAVIRDAN